MAAVPAGESGRIDSRYRNIFLGSVEQVHRFSEVEPEIEFFIRRRNF